MRKARILVLSAMLAAMLALGGGTASAEGHHCRHWYPDPYQGGYWLWLDCGDGVQPGKWTTWYADLLWYEWNSEHLDIRDPYYY